MEWKPFSGNTISAINVVTPQADDLQSDRPLISIKARKCDEEDPLLPTLSDLDGTRKFSLKPSPKSDREAGGFFGNDQIPSADAVESFPNSGVPNDENDDAADAASILCSMKNATVLCVQDVFDIVEMTAAILSGTPTYDENSCNGVYESHIEPDELGKDADFGDNFQLCYPDRLATDDDVEEVNQLHQYVRKDLLEIFVIPQEVCTSQEESDEDEDYGEDDDKSIISVASRVVSDGPNTRGSALRSQTSICSTSSHSVAPPPPKQRYYPGRVGMRCVHCANLQRKSTTKAAFYPLRLKNIYREVCAWQRIHFKKCPMVPDHVREKYEYLKQADPSRGKVRYWETSARRIGLMNNPDRDDGVIFADFALKRVHTV